MLFSSETANYHQGKTVLCIQRSLQGPTIALRGVFLPFTQLGFLPSMTQSQTVIKLTKDGDYSAESKLPKSFALRGP